MNDVQALLTRLATDSGRVRIEVVRNDKIIHTLEATYVPDKGCLVTFDGNTVYEVVQLVVLMRAPQPVVRLIVVERDYRMLEDRT